MADDIHQGRTPIGMIVNTPEGRIRFRYREDGPIRRMSYRIELERAKRAERKAGRERDDRERGAALER
ncbi:hypothetical protein [Nocardia carnea]|uniref:hypothetical protein n=1 Tax=Nocardia carnea TaxID=37328 RepID=UPI002456B50D|nr:hypothetical protein [Nocardia carnea]